jgi:nitrogen fixation NifU-like protein
LALDDLYREVIMDHYRSPRNYGSLDNPTHTISLTNPFCGDEIILELQVSDGVVNAAKFTGRGCSISQASASLMTEAIIGKPVDDAVAMMRGFRRMMRGQLENEEEMGDLVALAGVGKFPVRVKCAVFPWEALRQALTPEQLPDDD